MSKMGQYVLEQEELFYDQVADVVRESENCGEAVARSREIATEMNLMGYLTESDMQEAVGQMWTEFWSKYP